MTISIDFTRAFTTVGGRLPLKYLQDGYGFSPGGECLGRYSDQGEPLGDEGNVAELPAADGVEIVGEARPEIPHIRPAVGEEAATEGQGEGEQTAGSVDPEALTASYNAKSVKELKALAKGAEIPGASTLNKAALVEALVERDTQAEGAA